MNYDEWFRTWVNLHLTHGHEFSSANLPTRAEVWDAAQAAQRESDAYTAESMGAYGLSDGYVNSNDWWSGTDRAKQVIAHAIRALAQEAL